MTRARISITIPESLLEAADRKAKELDRSRSWVISDALRNTLVEAPAESVAGRPVDQVYEPVRVYSPRSIEGLGSYRLNQLRADLDLTPTERVREAEKTGRVGSLREGKSYGNRIITFDRFEDYLDWCEKDRTRPR